MSCGVSKLAVCWFLISAEILAYGIILYLTSPVCEILSTIVYRELIHFVVLFITVTRQYFRLSENTGVR